MDKQAIYEALKHNFDQFTNLVLLKERPLLAHYTSLDSIEKITRSGELWFSNPLFMNDIQEVRFGIVEGHRIFIEEFSEESFVKSVGQHKVAAVQNAFLSYYREFDEQHALNIFVFCLAQHDPNDIDGRLSMWRGYGGNGGGAALVFNTSFATANEDSPILIGKVIYATDEQRRDWIRGVIQQAKKLLIENLISDDLLYIVAYHVFQLLKIHALSTKHRGFEEEREWRIIYLPERDTNKLLSDGYSYIVGKSGIEPKLRFPVKPLPFENPATWTFESIVDRIILGPSLSTVLAQNAVKKMFISLNKQGFADKVVASTIPFRLS